MSIQLLRTKSNSYLVDRYINFINSKLGRKLPKGHRHHILPKHRDMFPEFKDLKVHVWNGIILTEREHFIAHWILSKIFPNSSQSRAFYLMTNEGKRKKSKDYEKSRKYHIENMYKIYTTERNLKISTALKGKPKSTEHISKLIGHEVSLETREKLRKANLGKTYSDEVKLKMSKSRLGKPRKPHSEDGKNKIANSKKSAKLKWYNDGKVSKLFTSPPKGWSKGRLRWIN